MDVEVVMAQLIVTDHARSVDFYTALFGRRPDSRPMDKLAEWYMSGAGAVQVFEEAERAGRSGVTLQVSDLDGEVAVLDRIGVAHEPITEATYVRWSSWQIPTTTGSSSSVPSSRPRGFPTPRDRLACGRRAERGTRSCEHHQT